MRAQSVIFQSKAISSITIGDCGKHYSAFNCKKYKEQLNITLLFMLIQSYTSFNVVVIILIV